MASTIERATPPRSRGRSGGQPPPAARSPRAAARPIAPRCGGVGRAFFALIGPARRSSLGRPLEAVEVGMTMLSRSMRTSPSATRSARRRFTLWRVPPIMPARSVCVYGQSRRTSVRWPSGPPRARGGPAGCASRPARSRKWRSSTCLVSRRSSRGQPTPGVPGAGRARCPPAAGTGPARGRGLGLVDGRSRSPSGGRRRAAPARRRSLPGGGWR